MRALCLTAVGGPDALAVLNLPAPVLQRPGDVRIGIRAAALNHLDLWMAKGTPGVTAPSFPHVVGTDGAGVVLETGSAVTHVEPGDRVLINPGVACGECDVCAAGDDVFCRQFGVLGEHRPGLAAEEVVVPGRNVLPIRGDWNWPAAAAFTLSTLTAWRMLTTRARLTAGETVLIWGIGGGVAIAALQIARYLGARVAVTSSSPEKLARARELGAELGLDHAAERDVPRAVKDHFGGGVSVAVDTVGAPTWARSLRALRPGGRLVTCGATGGPMVDLDLRRLFWFQWSLLGSTMGTAREFAEITALGDAGWFRPRIDGVFPITSAADAYRRMAHGEQFGKLVLEVSP
ncbi:MAG TPA: zinc-binding dehydrogenase [Gemmatimonadales bacterium]|jgi:NADPH:quinone reductase-like Zn-dependent oxidoreductase